MSYADALRGIADLGLSAEQYAGVLRALACVTQGVTQDVTGNAEPTANALRQRKFRAQQKALRNAVTVTNVSVPSPPPAPSPKEIPQTPLEITPTPEPPPPKSKRGTRLDENWVLSKKMGDWALAQGLPRDRILLEAEKMRDWSINAGKIGVKPDWFAAWRNWVKKAIDDLPRSRGSPGRPLSGLAALTENFKQELENDGYGRQGEESGDPVADARFPLLTGPNH